VRLPVASVVAAIATTAVAQAAAEGCRVAYTTPAQWGGGFTGNVAVTNLGERLDGWRLTWSFPTGQRVTQGWNAVVTQNGSQLSDRSIYRGSSGRPGRGDASPG